MDSLKSDKNKYVLGQYFTNELIIRKVIELIIKYKNYDKKIKILEPGFGTGNFIRILKENGFKYIDGCEIDPKFTEHPQDFFLYPLNEKYDLIIGNPPFTKYNIKESYFFPKKYAYSSIHPSEYLPIKLLKREKIRIEDAFILKSIKHLKDKNSTIGFVLPISFFVKNKNLEIKKNIIKDFNTIIIYQNDMKWVNAPISCCFAIFTNTEEFKHKIVLIYESNEKAYEEVLNEKTVLTDETIPKSYFYKKNVSLTGTTLSEFIEDKPIKYNKSYSFNNVSGANILNKNRIPPEENVEDYCLAIVRVGNASVGRAGLINIKKDTLNGMFYVFKFKNKYDKDKNIKEKIYKLINENQNYFKNITFRVGSKSIKKEDILSFKVDVW